MNTKIVPIGCAAICVALLCAIAIAAHAATITVINTNDSGPGSLRQALADANDGDTINFDPALNGQTINLTSAELVIDNSITISGPGPDVLAVSGVSRQFTVFHVMPKHTVTIEGLTVSDGRGGVWNDHATLTVNNCTVTSNLGGRGAGILNDAYYQQSATLTIVNSTISNNCACYAGEAFGGGIYSDGTLTIVNTTVSGNGAVTPSPEEGYGGGIYGAGGTLTVTGSTITGNFASLWGGGIDGGGTITNSTISGNTAGGGQDHRPGSGGGIFGGGTINNSTISGNTAWGDDFKGPGLGGGIYSFGIVITDSILSYNSATAGGSIYGGATSHGYNVCSDACGLTGPGDQINTDPLLGPLQNNGGPTLTHALSLSSPAIDAGDPSFTPPPLYDQRGPGFWRVRNGRIDIGSFEVQAGTTPTPTPSQINLSAIGRRVQGRHTVDLTWSGANSANIDIYRDGVVIATVPNNGSYKDFIGVRGGNVRYTYKVCEAGTSNCSNEVTVRFGGPPL